MANPHVMIDLETLAKTPDAEILTIAAVKFDPYSDVVDNNVYYEYISPVQGRKRDVETVKWWGEQSPEAQAEVFNHEDDEITLGQALMKLGIWIDNPAPIVWANGPSFDIVILEHAYRQFDLPIPWKYRDVRDCRTVYDVLGGATFDLGEADKHIGWKDCYSQIVRVQRCIAKLPWTKNAG